MLGGLVTRWYNSLETDLKCEQPGARHSGEAHLHSSRSD
jgi:hypothetical protein